MWQAKLLRLHELFPEVVRLYQPVVINQIRQTENMIGLRLSDLDVSWHEFLEISNGASILDYCLAGAMTSHIASIASVNKMFQNEERFSWLQKHFTCFMVDSSSMNIGFVRDGLRMRCVAFLGEPSDMSVLPIASSFNAFMQTFLLEVESTLGSRKLLPGKKWPYAISEFWPLNLSFWCDNDPGLRTMLQQGDLDDLFRHNHEYSDLVDSVI